jgi:hypothetical protein
MDEPEYKEILLSFIGYLTLTDHMGDVREDISTVLGMINVEVEEWDDYIDLRKQLGKIGIKTLYGTSLGDE